MPAAYAKYAANILSSSHILFMPLSIADMIENAEEGEIAPNIEQTPFSLTQDTLIGKRMFSNVIS